MPGVKHYLIAAVTMVGVGLVAAVLFVWSGIYNVSAARSHFQSVEWLLDVVRRQSVGFHGRGIETPDDLDDRDLVVLGARHFEYGCAPCHGAPGEAPPSNLAPQLSGQTADYLSRALREYRDDLRPSGIMQLFANELDDAQIADLAAAYAGAAPALIDAEEPAGNVASGAGIFELGLPEDDVPACTSCHGASARFPALSPVSAEYAAMQLKVFRAGERDGTSYGRIMTAVAERLSDDDIEDLAAYVGSLSAPRSAGTAATETAPQPDAAAGDEVAP